MLWIVKFCWHSCLTETHLDSTHENYSHFKKLKKGSDRLFCLTFSCISMLFGCYSAIQRKLFHLPFFVSGGILLLLAFTKPQLVSHINRIWTKIGATLGKIVTPIIMGLFYWTIFLFISFVLKIFRKDLLKLKYDRSAKTYWLQKKSNENFRHPF